MARLVFPLIYALPQEFGEVRCHLLECILSLDFLLTDAIPFNKNSYIFQRAKSAMTSGVGGLTVFEQSKSLLDIDMTQCIRSDL